MKKTADIDIFKFERIDKIGFGDLELIQNPKEFCYGVDAVILSDFAVNGLKKKPGIIFDLGTGTGVIPLILSHKINDAKIVGVEVQEESFNRAERNAKINGLEDRISFLNCDVKDVLDWGHSYKGNVDAIVCNPPYFISGGGIKNDMMPKTIARHETTAGINEFFEAASFLLKPKGDLFMVHRPSRLTDICFYARKNKLEPKEMRFVSPTKESVPNILLIHFVKGGGNELKLMEPLAVYDGKGNYTQELLKAYED